MQLVCASIHLGAVDIRNNWDKNNGGEDRQLDK